MLRDLFGGHNLPPWLGKLNWEYCTVQEYCVSPAHLRPRDDDVDYYYISILSSSYIPLKNETYCFMKKNCWFRIREKHVMNLLLDVVIKCISFTAKEALEGLPLHLQIDSYIENQILNESGILGPRLVNRAFCPLKAFVRYIYLL